MTVITRFFAKSSINGAFGILSFQMSLHCNFPNPQSHINQNENGSIWTLGPPLNPRLTDLKSPFLIHFTTPQVGKNYQYQKEVATTGNKWSGEMMVTSR